MFDVQALVAKNRSGSPVALPSFCTASDVSLRAALGYAARCDLPVLIEATCNQVNQFGGYTGLTPRNAAERIRALAHGAGVAEERLVLGGDHLGPHPWRDQPIETAMSHAKTLVKDYVEAGFRKVHLDASMPCGGEPTPSFELVAARAAELARVAEACAPDPSTLSYVIGTEVPVPGGEADDMSGVRVTTPERLAETIETHCAAFKAAGVSDAMDRVRAVVVQPGVDFSNDAIFHYDRAQASALTKALDQHGTIGFEAHSTDYQRTSALAELVQDHSVFLKVGPEITFRMREGLLALEQIARELSGDAAPPLRRTLLDVMQADPRHWQGYYAGSQADIEHQLIYSYSDRIRYYWDTEIVARAVGTLLALPQLGAIPATLASQYGMSFPIADKTVSSSDVLNAFIETTIGRYYAAAGWG